MNTGDSYKFETHDPPSEPSATSDEIGLKLCLAVILLNYREYQKRRNRISQCLSRLVRRGEVRRVRRGAYELAKP